MQQQPLFQCNDVISDCAKSFVSQMSIELTQTPQFPSIALKPLVFELLCDFLPVQPLLAERILEEHFSIVSFHP